VVAETPPDLRAVEEIAHARVEIKAEVEKRIIGQQAVIDQLLTSLFARGHCLFVGVPGLAKTLLISTLAEVLDLSFNRIQFTPDLMPSDITGTDVLEEDHATGRRVFRFIRGPLFANIVLADEINRTPPKTQAALLQAMQEQRVSAGGQTHVLQPPFLVFATQNPIEQEGTYPLPEAQVDRFMLKVVVGYPTREEERVIMDRMAGVEVPRATPVVSPEQISRARDVVHQIYVDDKVKDYILDIVWATREPERFGLNDLKDAIDFGASPRATLFLSLAARAHAFLRHRGFVTPEDVKAVGMDVLRHRVTLTYEAEAEELTPEQVVQRVFDKIEVP